MKFLKSLPLRVALLFVTLQALGVECFAQPNLLSANKVVCSGKRVDVFALTDLNSPEPKLSAALSNAIVITSRTAQNIKFHFQHLGGFDFSLDFKDGLLNEETPGAYLYPTFRGVMVSEGIAAEVDCFIAAI